jgi:hypothetical protein
MLSTGIIQQQGMLRQMCCTAYTDNKYCLIVLVVVIDGMRTALTQLRHHYAGVLLPDPSGCM